MLTSSQFGIFFAANGLSLIGSWMQKIACGWLVWQWTGSAFWLGVLAAGDLLPVVFTAPFAGVAADRWDRLKQNRIAQLLSAILAIGLAALQYFAMLELYSLIVLVSLQGLIVAAIQPARLAMVHQMVPREDLGTAVSLNSANVNLARLIGPAVAGVMILQLDIVWIFVANAIVTLLFVLALGRIRLAPRALKASSETFWKQLVDGFRFVLNSPLLCAMLLIMLVGGMGVRSMLELMPAIAAMIFDNSAAGLATLTGSAAVGAVAAALFVRRTATQNLLLKALVWWGLGALAAIGLTHAASHIMAVAAAVVMGGCITLGLIETQSFVQITTPDDLRGRTLSIHGLIARSSPAFGALLLGFFADRAGLPETVLWSSLALVVLFLALLPFLGRLTGKVTDQD